MKALYKIELYKLGRKKMLAVGALLSGIFMIWYFFAGVNDEQTVINGISYTGYEAVQMDREITGEYCGVMTDEKAAEIIGQYGFPHEVKEWYSGWQDGNYLNTYVTDWYSDGYYNSWDDYRPAEKLIPMAESKLATFAGGGIELAYTKGWEKVLEFWNIGFMIASVFLIIALAPVFSEEIQMKTAAVIFTTEHGKNKDVWAKFLASLTITFLAYFSALLLGIILCGSVYGFAGENVPRGVINGYLVTYFKENLMEIRYVGMEYAIIALGGIFMLAVLCLWCSSRFKTPFTAVSVSAFIWIAPFALVMIFNTSRVIYFLGVLQPIFLIVPDAIIESGSFRLLQVGVMAIAVVLGIANSLRRYRSMELS